jgi:hypothetical protein
VDLARKGAIAAIDATRLIAERYEAVDAVSVLGTINEDRSVAGMPRLHETSIVRDELTRRASEIADVLAALLESERDADSQLAEVLERAAAAHGGVVPDLLHLVTDRYHLARKRVLEDRATRVQAALDELRRVAADNTRRAQAVPLAMLALEHAVRHWDQTAQPIQLLARSKGLTDEASVQLAREVRAASVEIANEHGLHEEALTITNLLAEAFQEVPHIVDIVDADRQALEDILGEHDAERELEAIRPIAEAVRSAVSALGEAVRAAHDKFAAYRGALAAVQEAVSRWSDAAGAPRQDPKLQEAVRKIDGSLAMEIRSVAVDLANEHERHQDARFLILFALQQLGGSPETDERLRADLKTLKDLIERKETASAEAARLRKEKSLDILIGQDRLIMTPETIQFKSQTIETAHVDRVRYGVYKHYLNGVRVSREFTVWVGTPRHTIKIECVRLMEREEVISERMGLIIGKLWGLVGAKLTWELLAALSRSQSVVVGSVRLTRRGAWLTKRRWLRSEPLFCPWTDMRYWSAGGNLVIGSASEPKATALLSYRDVDNAHILEQLLEFLWKDGNYAKLERGEFTDS